MSCVLSTALKGTSKLNVLVGKERKYGHKKKTATNSHLKEFFLFVTIECFLNITAKYILKFTNR